MWITRIEDFLAGEHQLRSKPIILLPASQSEQFGGYVRNHICMAGAILLMSSPCRPGLKITKEESDGILG